MAKVYSLEELQKRYSALKGQVTKLTTKEKGQIDVAQKDFESKKTAHEEAATNLNSIKIEIEGRTKTIAAYEQRHSEKDLEKDSRYKEEKKALNELINVKLPAAEADEQKKKEEYEAAEAKLDAIKAKLITCEAELAAIRGAFARDSRINDVLKDMLGLKYDQKIEEKNALLDGTKQQSQSLTKALSEDTTLVPFVDKLKAAYEERKKYSYEATTPEAQDATKKYLEAAQQLRLAVNGMKEFQSVTLTDADLKAIIDDKPVLEGAIEQRQDELKTLEEKKEEAMRKLEAVKVAPSGTKEELEAQKEIKEQELTKLAGDLTAKKDEITNLETELKTDYTEIEKEDFDFDHAIEELDEAILAEVVPEGLTPEEEAELTTLEGLTELAADDPVIVAENKATADLAKAKKELADTGYITEDAIKALGIAPDAYKKFFNLDRALRQKFLAVKSTNIKDTERDSNPAVVDLNKAIQEYQDCAKALEAATGFSIAAWQDYLLRDVKERIDNGDPGFEEVPEEYATELSKDRINKFKDKEKIDTYGSPSNPVDATFKRVEDALKGMEEQETAILAGKDPTEYKNHLTEYIKQTNLLPPEIKESFFNNMKSAIAIKAKGFFGKIKAFFSNLANKAKTTFSPTVKTEPADYKKLVDAIEPATKDAEKAKRDREAAEIAAGLTQEKRERRDELKEKARLESEAKDRRTALEKKKGKVEQLSEARKQRDSLTEQQEILTADVDKIQDQIDNAPVTEDIKVSDTRGIHTGKGNSIKNDFIDEMEL